MPGAVGDELDQRLVAVRQREDPLHDLDVRKLVRTTDVVHRARLAPLEDGIDCRTAILDEEPVPHLHPVAVDRQGIAGERVQDAERDQLLGMLARPVVVGCADDQRLRSVGAREGGDEQVTARLGGGVRGGRVERRDLGRGALVEIAVHLVRGDLEVADARVAGGLEQDVGPVDVGGDELARRLDRAVDVGLGGEVDGRVATVDRPPDRVAVGDVCLDQFAALRRQAVEVLATPRVRELVEDTDAVLRICAEAQADVVRPDEPGAAGDQQPHAASCPSPSPGSSSAPPPTGSCASPSNSISALSRSGQ